MSVCQGIIAFSWMTEYQIEIELGLGKWEPVFSDLASPGNMKFSGVLPFIRLENARRAMACDLDKFSPSMFKTLESLLNVT